MWLDSQTDTKKIEIKRKGFLPHCLLLKKQKNKRRKCIHCFREWMCSIYSDLDYVATVTAELVFICECLEKVLVSLCAQTVSEKRKVPQDVSAMAFSVLSLSWKVLSTTLEICVLRFDKEVVKLRGLYLIENTM